MTCLGIVLIRQRHPRRCRCHVKRSLRHRTPRAGRPCSYTARPTFAADKRPARPPARRYLPSSSRRTRRTRRRRRPPPPETRRINFISFFLYRITSVITLRRARGRTISHRLVAAVADDFFFFSRFFLHISVPTERDIQENYNIGSIPSPLPIPKNSCTIIFFTNVSSSNTVKTRTYFHLAFKI